MLGVHAVIRVLVKIVDGLASALVYADDEKGDFPFRVVSKTDCVMEQLGLVVMPFPLEVPIGFFFVSGGELDNK